MKKIGLIVNPIAGIGGPVGLKGSDGEDIQKLALSKGAVKESGKRAEAAFALVGTCKDDILLYCGPGEMGETIAKNLELEHQVVPAIHSNTTAADERPRRRSDRFCRRRRHG